MGCCTQLTKWILHFFNLLAVIGGILLIILGAVILGSMGDLKTFSQVMNTNTIPIMIIVLGGVIFVVAFFGCCGAIKEINWCMLMYSIFVFILLCLQIALTVWVFVKRDEFLSSMDDIVKQAWNNHDSEPDSSMGVLEVTFKCCGLANYTNYGGTVPNTCCGTISKTTSCPPSTYQTVPGCEKTFYNFWDSNLEYVRWGGLAVIIIEFLALVSSCGLAEAVRHARTQDRNYG